MFHKDDFREYRHILGFESQQKFKDFLSAKDIKAEIDFCYIEKLNNRLLEIFTKINKSYYDPCDIESFLQNYLFNTYDILKNNGILNNLNNQGRRKEEVYFSWMRGFLVCEYFKKAISEIFDIPIDKIKNIGDDDFHSLQTFRRTPRADLEIDNYRLEIQSGFQGINDIKEHKVREAKNILNDKNIKTLVIHFDLFNGQVAFVDISKIQDNDLNWITRQQMEGQSVFNIDSNYFQWLFLNKAPKIEDLSL
ncbi:restriction endonuclease [Campylobacter coli]|uniref:Restriction endonuclease n=1 Tax=Campylobacter jejuni TaxID=197 RepID=A0A6F9MTR8_CAMJU|nr:restriction endonuclease [Campylobacter coli]EAJ7021781.1 restriction endonuclease [Campylobacter coli]EAW0594024.1 restriction endonuclease [Campylobacter coli]EGK8255719.1 restriction endonuclease [Campylobacter coli]EGS0795216.1 restriction endonuclease [Campylobacter coli]